MRKVKFVSGFNAKLALIACAVAGFTLTGCEKEDFNVDVPNIGVTVPEVDITIPEIPGYPQVDPVEGQAYLTLSATANTGEALNGVNFAVSVNGEAAVDYTDGNLTFAVPQASTVEISASKSGFYTNVMTVTVPAVPKNQVLNVPVGIVLDKVELSASDVLAHVDETNIVETAEAVANRDLTLPDGEYYQPGQPYSASVPVPDRTPYMTAAQKDGLRAQVAALSADTRALGDDITVIKDKLYAMIDNFASAPNMGATVNVQFTVSELASRIRMIVTTTTNIVTITLTASSNDVERSVSGNCSVPAASVVTAEADGVNIGHGHGHGDDANAGGGVAE